ncbi:translation initiation factor IF-3 [Gammaproteobacteria bacterium]|nr:translation initiation factor IF-3 [Gammaproteobacteria bacterium]
MNKRKSKNKINDQIEANFVKVIGEDGTILGEMSKQAGIEAAADKNMDLVEVSSNSNPVICKIMDWGQHVFQSHKKVKKQKKVQVKCIYFRPVTDQNDSNIKLKQINKFLDEGHKVKIVVRFRGREVSHSELGFEKIKEVLTQLSDKVTVMQEPSMEGKQIHTMLSPGKRNKSTKEED